MTQIAVIEAGIVGLNAALTLQDAGLLCIISQASNRIGGRMSLNMMSSLIKSYLPIFQQVSQSRTQVSFNAL
jgi:monoamine oxidase